MPTSRTRTRVLLIEDGKIEQLLFKNLVNKLQLPYDVTYVSSVAGARSEIAKCKFEVIVCDFYLEDGTATEVFHLISDCPLIVVTSAEASEVAIASLKAGAYDFILKDVDQAYLRILPVVIEKAIVDFRAGRDAKLLAQAMQGTQDGLLILNQERHVIFANPALNQLFQVNSLSVRELDIAEAIPGVAWNDLWWEWESKGLKEWSTESIVSRHQMPDLPVQVKFAHSATEKGERLILIVVRDISKQKEAESGRRELEKRLIESQRMETLGVVAGGVAHDFNNILASIIGYTELAEGDAGEGTLLKRNLQEVLKASYRARDLVDQILSFSRGQKQRNQLISVANVVDEVKSLMQMVLTGTGIELITKLPVRPVEIAADPTELHQVLLNLCTNAQHAMEPLGGGVLTVIVEQVLASAIGEEASLALRAVFPRDSDEFDRTDFVCIKVSDTGHGIAESVQPQIFDRFFSTKAPGKGSGLGLAVVKRVVKELSGTISLSSAEGVGTTFAVYLPILPLSGEVVEVIETPQEGSIEGTATVLFIDDEESIIRFGKQLLERLGYKVIEMSSSVDALELFSRDPNRFDLVITDMMMPGITGDILAKKLFEIRPELPIILCSGYNELLTPERARTLGFSAYLKKPISSAELGKAIRIALSKRGKGPAEDKSP